MKKRAMAATAWCALVGIALTGAASGATLQGQFRRITAYSTAGDGFGIIHEQQLVHDFQGAGEFVSERHAEASFGVALSVTDAEQDSFIAHDLFTLGASTSMTVNDPALPSFGAGWSDASLSVDFEVTEPEFWSLGLSARSTNPAFPHGLELQFTLQTKEEAVIHEFYSDSSIEIADAITLAPGIYELRFLMRTQVDSYAFPNGDPSARADFFFRRYATSCPGDAQGDRLVDFLDLNIVLGQYGSTSAPGSLVGDVNDDGAVDFIDLNIVLSAYGTAC